MMHSFYVAVLGKPSTTINDQASCLTPIDSSHIVGDSNAQTWRVFGGFKPHHPPSTSHMFSYLQDLHTLAQNSHCEFWCGMHLTCKNAPITPDRNGSVKRPEKNWKGAIAMSSARWNKLTDCENRANQKKIESKLFGNCMVFLGLASSHVRKWSRYVTKASLRHITMERQCLRWWMTARPCIHPCLSRGFTSIQMFHTHTLEKTWIIGVIRRELDPKTCN